VTRVAARPARLQPELFVYSFPVRVYFENTDAGGVVYHAEYLKFLERARTEWLRHLGYDHQALARNHRIVFVVTQAVADFLKPARLDDNLAVSVQLESLGKVRCVFVQEVPRGRPPRARQGHRRLRHRGALQARRDPRGPAPQDAGLALGKPRKP